jgi:hypothetical protein
VSCEVKNHKTDTWSIIKKINKISCFYKKTSISNIDEYIRNDYKDTFVEISYALWKRGLIHMC